MQVYATDVNKMTSLVAKTRGVKHFYPANTPMHVFSAFEPVYNDGDTVRDWKRKNADCPEEAE